MKRLPLALIACALAGLAGPVRADEVFAGGFAHGVKMGIAAPTEEKGVDLQLGYRTDPLSHIFSHPRVYGLLSENLSGDTSFASVGLLWRRDFTASLYGQFGLGVAVHDGAVNFADVGTRTDKIVFGSRVLFQPELDLGWSLSRHWAVEASYVHISNGHLWTRINPGMDDVGARLVYRFGGR
jgi:lipid A 3-O-deacylase